MKDKCEKRAFYYDIIHFEEQLNLMSSKGYYLSETNDICATYARKDDIASILHYTVRKVDPSHKDEFISQLPDGWSVAKTIDKRVIVLSSNEIEPKSIPTESPFYEYKTKEYILKGLKCLLSCLVTLIVANAHSLWRYRNFSLFDIIFFNPRSYADEYYRSGDFIISLSLSAFAVLYFVFFFVMDVIFMKKKFNKDNKTWRFLSTVWIVFATALFVVCNLLGIIYTVVVTYLFLIKPAL